MKKLVLSAALALSLTACGKPAADSEQAGDVIPADTGAAPAATAAADPNAAPASFAQCAVCHSVKPDGKHGVGPNLFGVVGRKAGAAAGYAYSPAMQSSGLTWDDATIDKYLTKPMDLVKGTKMAYAGQGDPAKRKEIIDWLKAQK
jgi:cytochrome c